MTSLRAYVLFDYNRNCKKCVKALYYNIVLFHYFSHSWSISFDSEMYTFLKFLWIEKKSKLKKYSLTYHWLESRLTFTIPLVFLIHKLHLWVFYNRKSLLDFDISDALLTCYSIIPPLYLSSRFFIVIDIILQFLFQGFENKASECFSCQNTRGE